MDSVADTFLLYFFELKASFYFFELKKKFIHNWQYICEKTEEGKLFLPSLKRSRLVA